MAGPYIHRIDPIIGSIAGIHLWWYGLSYALGFFNAHLFLRRHRDRLGLSLRAVYDLTLFLAVGVLLGGRSVVVFANEWSFYRAHPMLIPAVWLGGLATHGLIIGGASGVFLYCLIHRRPVLPILDALAVPTALILGCGRIGNFIDGQIVGSVTNVPWAVKFPEADGFRHPVVLYDGLKNFLLIPLLLWIERRQVPPGRIAALFVFLYAGLRIPIDLFREYHAENAATGQVLNVLMATTGASLLVRNILRWRANPANSANLANPPNPANPANLPNPVWRPLAFAALLVFALVIPSDSTRDIPLRYGRRHPGLHYSAIYRPISGTIPRLPDPSR